MVCILMMPRGAPRRCHWHPWRPSPVASSVALMGGDPLPGGTGGDGVAFDGVDLVGAIQGPKTNFPPPETFYVILHT